MAIAEEVQYGAAGVQMGLGLLGVISNTPGALSVGGHSTAQKCRMETGKKHHMPSQYDILATPPNTEILRLIWQGFMHRANIDPKYNIYFVSMLFLHFIMLCKLLYIIV